MEDHNLNGIPLPDTEQISFITVLDSIQRTNLIYGCEESYIKQTREKFRTILGKYKKPEPVPTVYRNDKYRSYFVEEEHKRLKIEHVKPPEETNVVFTFADDVFLNIFIIFSKEFLDEEDNPYISHKSKSKVVFLRRKFSGEEAFEELLTSKPPINDDKFEVVKQSLYVERNHRRWKVEEEECRNSIQFVVDFSVIYPEDVWSTAYVSCYDCGEVAEIALCDAVKEVARREIWSNIAQSDIEKTASEKERCVVRLPCMSSLSKPCSFREGLIGFTPISHRKGTAKPSLYVRVRLTFFTNKSSSFRRILHTKEKIGVK